jgi:hypothetical protein
MGGNVVGRGLVVDERSEVTRRWQSNYLMQRYKMEQEARDREDARPFDHCTHEGFPLIKAT